MPRRSRTRCAWSAATWRSARSRSVPAGCGNSPASQDALRAASPPWRRWFVDLTDGTRWFDLDLATVAEDAGVRLRWSELYRVLRQPIAEHTHHGHELVALEADSSGRLVPVFTL